MLIFLWYPSSKSRRLRLVAPLGSLERQRQRWGQGSFAIVTADPNEWMVKYHDRIGVIIQLKNYQRWLGAW
jgi:putative SOS response-associated peptidase YedK